MSYVFLIMVIYSNTSNMQVEPMQSMEQCRAAIQAINIAKDKATWGETLPRTGFLNCVEVNRD